MTRRYPRAQANGMNDSRCFGHLFISTDIRQPLNALPRRSKYAALHFFAVSAHVHAVGYLPSRQERHAQHVTHIIATKQSSKRSRTYVDTPGTWQSRNIKNAHRSQGETDARVSLREKKTRKQSKADSDRGTFSYLDGEIVKSLVHSGRLAVYSLLYQVSPVGNEENDPSRRPFCV